MCSLHGRRGWGISCGERRLSRGRLLTRPTVEHVGHLIGPIIGPTTTSSSPLLTSISILLSITTRGRSVWLRVTLTAPISTTLTLGTIPSTTTWAPPIWARESTATWSRIEPRWTPPTSSTCTSAASTSTPISTPRAHSTPRAPPVTTTSSISPTEFVSLIIKSGFPTCKQNEILVRKTYITRKAIST